VATNAYGTVGDHHGLDYLLDEGWVASGSDAEDLDVVGLPGEAARTLGVHEARRSLAPTNLGPVACCALARRRAATGTSWGQVETPLPE